MVTGTDPEIARRRVQQYFDKVSHCVMTHGGLVEKFAGDAVMAAFGIPQAHEDDASARYARRSGCSSPSGSSGSTSGSGSSRARWSSTMRRSPHSRPGRRQHRREASAERTGQQHHDRPRRAPAHARPVRGRGRGPVEIRGRAELRPGLARHLCRGRPHTPRRPAGAARGRGKSSSCSRTPIAEPSRDHRAHLFTIYGDPGVGKSRLANEFVGGLEGATVLFGRALPYGEGVTYSALSDMVKTAAESRTTTCSTTRSRSCGTAARRGRPTCSPSHRASWRR